MDSEKTWDTIARSFDQTRRKPWKECLDFIEKLPKKSIVADIGCGNGRHLKPCAKKCKKVIGIDLSKELLDIVKEKLDFEKIKNVTLIHADATNIPNDDESVNAALYIATLHNIKGRNNRIKSLKEIKRILKKNGVALISVWSRWQDKYRKQFFKKWFTQKGSSEFGDVDIYWRQNGLDIPRFYHLYSKKEFQKDLTEAGFKIVEMKDVKIHSKRHPDNYFAIVRRD
jgi:ubiquinone/menaquinone biosynthesis C-methylase UbiE